MKNWLLKLSIPMKLAILAGVLGLTAFIIGNPSSNNKLTINAKEIALSTIKNQDRIEPLELADWLIKENSDFTLVDLRNEKEFLEYNIPTSLNIKMEDLLSFELMRNQKIILYGNDDAASAQAWFILKSSNYKGVYILNGGMNGWKNEILFPKLKANATLEQTSSFEKVKQISAYFGGTPQIVSGESTINAIQQTSSTALPKLSSPAGKVGGGAKKKKEGC